jgi:hypothetical protein
MFSRLLHPLYAKEANQQQRDSTLPAKAAPSLQGNLQHPRIDRRPCGASALQYRHALSSPPRNDGRRTPSGSDQQKGAGHRKAAEHGPYLEEAHMSPATHKKTNIRVEAATAIPIPARKAGVSPVQAWIQRTTCRWIFLSIRSTTNEVRSCSSRPRSSATFGRVWSFFATAEQLNAVLLPEQGHALRLARVPAAAAYQDQ